MSTEYARPKMMERSHLCRQLFPRNVCRLFVRRKLNKALPCAPWRKAQIHMRDQYRDESRAVLVRPAIRVIVGDNPEGPQRRESRSDRGILQPWPYEPGIMKHEQSRV